MADTWSESIQNLAKDLILGKERIEKYIKYIEKHDKFLNYRDTNLTSNYGAVLLCNQIADLSDNKKPFPLIDPFIPEHLKAASYHLSLGSRYRDKEGIKYLTKNKKTLIIPKNGIAIVTTNEWVNIPRFLIARWNLRVQMVYKGLVWVGSLQVDPRYQGFLFCPIYNLSNEPKQISFKEEIFTIDFVITNQFEEIAAKDKLWKPPDKYSTFDFDRLDAEFKIQSAPLTDLEDMGSRIADMEDDVKSQNRHMMIFQSTTFTVLAIIITALAFLATLKASDTAINIRFIPDDWIPYIALVIALLALLISLCNVICNRRKKNKNW